MKSFNRAVVPQAVAEFFGIKGEFSTQVDETLLTSLTLADLSDSPYLQFGIPVMRGGTPPAVGAQNGYCVATPGPGVALQISEVLIVNEAAAARVFAFNINTQAAVLAALTITLTANFVAVAPRDPSSLGRPSELRVGSRAGGLGNTIFRVSLPASTSLLIPLPRPGIILYGNSPAALTINNETVNDQFTVAFYAREWPLPG